MDPGAVHSIDHPACSISDQSQNGKYNDVAEKDIFLSCQCMPVDISKDDQQLKDTEKINADIQSLQLMNK